MLRKVLAAAATLSGALAYGRQLADQSLEKRLNEEIEEAKKRALVELDREFHIFARERYGVFVISLMIKTACVGGLYLAAQLGVLSALQFKAGLGGLVAAFVGYDMIRIAPYAPASFRVIRKYGLNLKRALTEHVAAIAFERARLETLERLQSRKARGLIALSSRTPDKIGDQVAAAVAELAGSVSFERARARAVGFVVRGAGLFALYAGFVSLIAIG